MPTSILSHYDGRKARGKLAIAPMRGESVEHVTYRSLSGRLADLRRKPRELNVCDNCGAFVYLNEDELAPPSDSELTELQSREPSKQSAGMLSVHNLAANAVGTDLVRFARCALRSVFPQPMGRTLFWGTGEFWVCLIRLFAS